MNLRKIALLTLACLLTFAGCPVLDPPSDPLQVTDALRAACPFRTDAELRASLIAIDRDRANGWSYDEELEIGLRNCVNDAECACNVLLVQQVYEE